MPFKIRDLVIKIDNSEGRRIVAFCGGASCEGYSDCQGQSCEGQSCPGPSGCQEETCDITVCVVTCDETCPETRERLKEDDIDIDQLREALQRALAKLS